MFRRCSTCEQELHSEQFATTKNNICRKCKSQYDRVYSKRRHLEYKLWIKEKGCVCCGFDHPDALEVHHLASKYKRFGTSQDKMYNVQDVDAGLAIVLCANCHLIFHSHFGGRSAGFGEQSIESTIDIINNSRRLKS